MSWSHTKRSVAGANEMNGPRQPVGICRTSTLTHRPTDTDTRLQQAGGRGSLASPRVVTSAGSVDILVILACVFRSQSRHETAHKLLDIGQDGLLIAREDPVIGAVEFDESCVRDVAGKMAAGADANGAIAVAVEHQSWNGNSTQKVPHIHIAQRLEHALDGSGARRGPEQACPPGSCLRIVRQAGREYSRCPQVRPRLQRAAAATCHTD